jgi:hypothetical protein
MPVAGSRIRRIRPGGADPDEALTVLFDSILGESLDARLDLTTGADQPPNGSRPSHHRST